MLDDVRALRASLERYRTAALTVGVELPVPESKAADDVVAELRR